MVFGVLLRLLGAGWIVAVPFFVLAAGAMISPQPEATQTRRAEDKDWSGDSE